MSEKTRAEAAVRLGATSVRARVLAGDVLGVEVPEGLLLVKASIRPRLVRDVADLSENDFEPTMARLYNGHGDIVYTIRSGSGSFERPTAYTTFGDSGGIIKTDDGSFIAVTDGMIGDRSPWKPAAIPTTIFEFLDRMSETVVIKV